MSASCQNAVEFNKCPTWHVARDLKTCQDLATPQGPYPTIDSCQTNTASCSNPSPTGVAMNPQAGGIYARWGATAPIKPGPMVRGLHSTPYPFCRSYAYSRASNECHEVNRKTPGASVGPAACVAAHSPYTYNGPTF